MKNLLSLFLCLMATAVCFAAEPIAGAPWNLDFGTSYSDAEAIVKDSFPDADVRLHPESQITVFNDIDFADRSFDQAVLLFNEDGLDLCMLAVAQTYMNYEKDKLDEKDAANWLNYMDSKLTDFLEPLVLNFYDLYGEAIPDFHLVKGAYQDITWEDEDGNLAQIVIFRKLNKIQDDPELTEKLGYIPEVSVVVNFVRDGKNKLDIKD